MLAISAVTSEPAPTCQRQAANDQLPFWPQDVRGISNALARSSLFGVANTRKGKRTHFKRKLIATLSNTRIEYTGEELRQDDGDVFLQVIHLAKSCPLGTPVRFTAHAMLRELGWTPNSASYSRLVDILDRLKASAIAVTVELPDGRRMNYTGSLLRAFRWQDPGQVRLRFWEVLLEPEIVALYQRDAYSRLLWELRLKLPPLAKWLHGFYATHTQPFPVKVETLHRLCGSETPELRKFRHRLHQALALLVERGCFSQASIDRASDLVSVTPASTQRQRQLAL